MPEPMSPARWRTTTDEIIRDHPKSSFEEPRRLLSSAELLDLLRVGRYRLHELDAYHPLPHLGAHGLAPLDPDHPGFDPAGRGGPGSEVQLEGDGFLQNQ